MWLKWIFNALLFLWIYHAVVRPLFMGYFYGDKGPGTPKQQPPTQSKPPSASPQRYTDDEGEYTDYEEIKK
jgi:hypothetical protein